jgi:radical SAM superfamily enzyme YgiQ (UPF0313 family)
MLIDGKIKVKLSQVNFTYGENAYLPYSAGLLQAFVNSDPRLKNCIEFMPIQFLRSDIDEAAKDAASAGILGLSSYIWNWEYTKELAFRAKSLNPNLVVVVGGPQVPHKEENLFQSFPYFDIVVIGEGEEIFRNLLFYFVSGEGSLEDIPGLAINREGVSVVTAKHQRISDITVIPSPYLTGVFDEILDTHDLKFQVSQETHRGCPYSCTFCDWGSATMQKVKRFDHKRIIEEFGWMAKNRIEVLYNCDANYGLFPEDEDLTDALILTKKTFGYPIKFRAAYAKNSNDRVFRIAEGLNNAGMSKGVTLSLQSLSELTLTNIKRRNMKINDFSELIDIYETARIPTYTELIVALPGETLESFRSGIDTLFKAGQHDGLNIYPAMVLPNAQLNEESYKSDHNIHFIETPMLLSHGTRESSGPQEKYNIVVQTSSMPRDKWVESMFYSWVTQALHCMNLTQQIAIYLNLKFEVSYTEIYTKFINWAKSIPRVEAEFESLIEMANSVSIGHGSLDIEDSRFGEIIWPVEEILFLRLQELDFVDLMSDFLLSIFNVDEDTALDLIKFQKFSLRNPKNNLGRIETFQFDWRLLRKNTIPEKTVISLKNATQNQFGDIKDYAREVVWYGRKGSTMLNELIEN